MKGKSQRVVLAVFVALALVGWWGWRNYRFDCRGEWCRNRLTGVYLPYLFTQVPPNRPDAEWAKAGVEWWCMQTRPYVRSEAISSHGGQLTNAQVSAARWATVVYEERCWVFE